MSAAGYLVANAPWRLIPLAGGAPILIELPPPGPTWPPNYGTAGVTYIPGPDTTGPLVGTQFDTPGIYGSNGTYTISTPGASFVKKEFFCRVSLAAPDVTFIECGFHGDPSGGGGGALITATSPAVKRGLIYDSIFDPIGVPRPNGIIGHDIKVYRSEMRNLIDPYDVSNSSAPGSASGSGIYASWLHDFAYFSPDGQANNQTHNDGMQVLGMTGVDYMGNYLQGYYGSYGTHKPNNTDPTPAPWPNPDLTAMLLNVSLGGSPGSMAIEDNWVEGFYVPFNFGGGGGGIDLGHAHRNHFKNDHGWPKSGAFTGIPYTFWRRSDQTLDVGAGTPNQNVYYDGTPIVVHTNG